MLEPVDHALRLGLLALCLLDEPDQFRNRRLARRLRHAHVERAAAVDRPAEHLVAGSLRDGHGLAGERGLIDAALARLHRAVEREPVAGFDDEHLADLDVADGHFREGAVTADEGGLGPELHQRLDGLARAAHRVVLEDVREREQKQQHRPLERRADGERAERGEDHQQVDIHLEVAERVEPGPESEPPPEDVRHRVPHPEHRVWRRHPFAHEARHHPDERERGEDGFRTRLGQPRAEPAQRTARQRTVWRLGLASRFGSDGGAPLDTLDRHAGADRFVRNWRDRFGHGWGSGRRGGGTQEMEGGSA